MAHVRPIPAKWRVWSGIALALVGTWKAQPRWPLILLGTLAICFGEGWRVWASGYLDKGIRLTVEGPYGWHRHPLYWGTFWIAVGLALLVHRPWFYVVTALYYAGIYIPTMRAEEHLLHRRFGTAYADYCRRVPRWWPRPSGAYTPPACRTSWQWTRVRAHREQRTVWTLAVWVAYFWIRWSVQ